MENSNVEKPSIFSSSLELTSKAKEVAVNILKEGI